MATISKNLPYKEIEPLPVPKEVYPNCQLGVARLSLILGSTGFGAGTGACLGLAEIGFTMITGAVVGGVIGLVAGFVLAYLLKIPSHLAHYRLATLKQMEETQTNPKALAAIYNLKDFFSVPFKGFYQTYQNHALHHEISVITQHIDPQRPDIKKVWKVFLEHLHNKKVMNADGYPVTLDLSVELGRLNGKNIGVKAPEWLDSKSKSYDKDLEQIVEIQSESFGRIGRFSKEDLKGIFKQHPLNRCLVVRQEGSDRILGFIWTWQKEGTLRLCGLARRPSATLVGVGNLLMEELISQIPDYQPLDLHVRKSNPAIELYKAYGFETTKLVRGFYSEGPQEDAYHMKLNWSKYHQVIAERHKKVV